MRAALREDGGTAGGGAAAPVLAPTLSLRDGNAAGAHFVPQLMRTTREMLQCDALTPLLLALRLVSVALLWEPRSYALLRRQDVSTLAPLADGLSASMMINSTINQLIIAAC